MKHRLDYGIYTVGDANFFPGIVAMVNSLKYYGYHGPVTVMDIGFEDWMVRYINDYRNVIVYPMDDIIRNTNFADVISDENPVMKGWAYKAFGIVEIDRYECWTFLDGDYLPLCNVSEHVLPWTRAGYLVGTEDGINEWDQRHEDAVGVTPGRYINMNAGFISMNMIRHKALVQEWRDVLTRRKLHDLWYGDQGALNAIIDKRGTPRELFDKRLWNQTWLNEEMAASGCCHIRAEGDLSVVWHRVEEQRIMGWHGMGWHKLWHQIGIDHYRASNTNERLAFYNDCIGKSPEAVVSMFRRFLFSSDHNVELRRSDYLLLPP